MNESENAAKDASDLQPPKTENPDLTDGCKSAEPATGSDKSTGAVQETLNWLSAMVPWGPTKIVTTESRSDSAIVSNSARLIVEQSKTASTLESFSSNVEETTRFALDWFSGFFSSSTNGVSSQVFGAEGQSEVIEASRQIPEALENQLIPIPTSFTVAGAVRNGFSTVGTAGGVAADAVRSAVVTALVSGIRLVSDERDRDEIIRWFVNAREILAHDASTTEIAKELYQSIDTLRFAKLLANTVGTSVSNYQGANLPLSLKVAIPVTAIGAAFFGMKYAGLVALGSGIGLPVILLLFLGTAGATAIVEAFIKDRNVRDPLTKLLLTFVAFETARRAKKELLDAMRADAMVPERAQVPEDEGALLSFLMSMDPVVFERHVMSFFEKDGYPTGLTSRSNDFGVDGYVFHPDGVIVVQCKRYGVDNPVGRPAIQQFKGVVEEQRAYRGYFVTTSRFTDQATESADKSERILLVDGDELLKWHKNGSKLK